MNQVLQALENTSFPNFWNEFVAKSKEEFGIEIFTKWLEKIEFCEKNGAELTLIAPSKFIRDWVLREFVENKKSANLLKIAAKIDNKIKKINIIAAKEPSYEPSTKTAISQPNENNVVNLSKYDNVFAFGSELNPKYTFENFINVKYNKLALVMAKIAAGCKETQMNLFDEKVPLYIHGGIGMGKTHLAQAIAWFIKENNKNKKVVYLSAEKFMYHFVQSVRNNNTMNFKEQFRSIDVLIIDDMQFIAGKQGTQDEFMQTFNSLVENNKQVILVCDRHPNDLEAIDEKLKSRISGGMTINFKNADFNDRLEILKAKVKSYNLKIDEKILEFLASKITKNIRDLDGALRKIIANNLFSEEKEITLEDAKEVALEYTNKGKNGEVTISKIQKIIAENFGIKVSLLSAANREKNVAKARQIAMYFAKNLTNESLPKIGKEFAKNHATVIYAVKSIQELSDKDLGFSKELKILEEKISG